jgi:hypothetical protein
LRTLLGNPRISESQLVAFRLLVCGYKSIENSGKRGISKKLSCHHVWLPLPEIGVVIVILRRAG